MNAWKQTRRGALCAIASFAAACSAFHERPTRDPESTPEIPPHRVASPARAGMDPGRAGVMTGSPAGQGATGGMVAGADGAGAGAGTSAVSPATPIDAGPAHAMSEWRMPGYDLGSTYFNSAETRLTRDNAAQLEVAWTADMGSNVYGAALQVGDKIFASSSTSVQAFDAASGQVLWTAMAASNGALAFEDDRLYLGTFQSLIALDAATGRQLWAKPRDPEQRTDGMSSPVVAGELLLTGGSNGGIELTREPFRGFVVALDRVTGDPVWLEHTVPAGASGVGIWSTPSVDLAADRVYVTTGNNYGPPATDTSDAFMAFDLKTGAVQWKNQRLANDLGPGGGGAVGDLEFGANPVLYEVKVDGVTTKVAAAGQKSGEAHALRRDDGMELWRRMLCTGSADGRAGMMSNSSWSGRHMLFGCSENGGAKLFALDGATGDVVWMRVLSGEVWSRIASANGVGAVGVGRSLELFDVDTGALIKTFPTRGTVASTITIANGRVAFGEGLSWATGSAGRTLTVLALPQRDP